jgi:hypothetical protein
MGEWISDKGRKEKGKRLRRREEKIIEVKNKRGKIRKEKNKREKKRGVLWTFQLLHSQEKLFCQTSLQNGFSSLAESTPLAQPQPEPPQPEPEPRQTHP